MTALDYCRAHRISAHSLARWRDLIDAGETPGEWRSQLHPSARPPISTTASTGAKPAPSDCRLTDHHAVGLARDKRSNRRSFTDDEKRAIVLETEAPGATISSVARRHDIVLSMIFRWRVQLGLKREKPALLAEVSVYGKREKSSPAAVLMHGLLRPPSGMAAVDLPDGRRVFAPADADPEAVRRHVADRAIVP